MLTFRSDSISEALRPVIRKGSPFFLPLAFLAMAMNSREASFFCSFLDAGSTCMYLYIYIYEHNYLYTNFGDTLVALETFNVSSSTYLTSEDVPSFQGFMLHSLHVYMLRTLVIVGLLAKRLAWS